MKLKRLNSETEINTGSTADIAFLLLIFFLVATTFQQEKGLNLKLPPEKEEEETIVPIRERNLFKILINSNQQLLAEGEPRENVEGLKDEVKEFILNPEHLSELSENPEKAIISLKTNRGTSYASFIEVLDELKGAYYEIYASNIGMSVDEYLKLRHSNKEEFQLYLRSKEGIPMNISIAEPTDRYENH